MTPQPTSKQQNTVFSIKFKSDCLWNIKENEEYIFIFFYKIKNYRIH